MDDVTAITQLKYAYLRSLDLKQWSEFESLFLPEVTAAYAELTFGSRDELVGYMRAALGPELITFHQVHHPEIVVDGDTATGTFYLHDKVFVPAFDVAIEGAAFYTDRFVRTVDGWRIAHTGYRRTFEASWTMSGLPGWSFKVGAAYET